MDLANQIRVVLRAQIAKGKLSVHLVARRTGYSQAHVSNFLNGKRSLSLEALECFLQVIGFRTEIFPADTPHGRAKTDSRRPAAGTTAQR